LPGRIQLGEKQAQNKNPLSITGVPFTTVQYHFYRWRAEGLLEHRIHQSTSAIIDSQSVKTTEAGVKRGLDGVRKSKGANATSPQTRWTICW